MRNSFVQDLIQFTVNELIDLDAFPNSTKIIKLLYLIDCDYYRTKGKLLSEIDWVRYKFGPYFFEWPNVIRQTGLNIEVEEIIRSDYGVIKKINTKTESGFERKIDFGTQSTIERIIKFWALEDLSSLLEYVYFDTEPMQNVKFGEKLNFSKIDREFNPYRKEKYIKIANEDSIKIKSMLKERELKREVDLPLPHYDAFYFNAIKSLENEEKIHGKIIGNLLINENSRNSLIRQKD